MSDFLRDPLAAALGLAWGLVLARPIAARARRREVRARAARQAPARAHPLPTRAPIHALPVVRTATRLARHRRARRSDRRLASELPIAVDLLAVAVGAGSNPTMAVDLARHWGPDHAARTFGRVRDAQDRGASFAEALELAAAESSLWAPVVDALLTTERLGAPIGPNLARVADAQRAELRRAAEAHARRVPVRLLFPLVFLVLPAFGLLTVVPVLVSGLTSL